MTTTARTLFGMAALCVALAASLAATPRAQASDAAAAAPAPAAKPAERRAEPARGTAAKAPASRAGSRAMDRIELDTTQITGNRELPKVMVVVPWKKSDIGDLVGKPINSLVDEALEPVDREVFRREVDYYGALGPDRPAAARSETAVTSGATAPPAEK